MQLDCYWDTDGDPRARCSPAHALVAHFLESDIQGSLELCQDILQAIAQIETGQLKNWEQTGNAHTLSLAATHACIEAEFDKKAQPCRLSVQELREALEGWQTFLEQGKKAKKPEK
jgi:uncharacterized protein YacL (UPF0231 family)